MAQRARWVADCVDLPIIADADTGYGDANSVARTVREFESAGIAGIHIEDQNLPKRCGAMPGVKLVELDEAVKRVRAALEARRDPNFLIIARTDAIATGDFEEAIRRAEAFAELGVDLVFVEDVASEQQVLDIPRRLPGVPLLFDSFETWPWTRKDTAELGKIGYKIIIMCLSVTFAYARAVQKVLRAIRDHGSTLSLNDGDLISRTDYERILSLEVCKKVEAGK
jgi:2-methylisocitrate lyase-like PEP mutase family enzyme